MPSLSEDVESNNTASSVSSNTNTKVRLPVEVIMVLFEWLRGRADQGEKGVLR
jgi:hypothetical protein